MTLTEKEYYKVPLILIFEVEPGRVICASGDTESFMEGLEYGNLLFS